MMAERARVKRTAHPAEIRKTTERLWHKLLARSMKAGTPLGTPKVVTTPTHWGYDIEVSAEELS